MKKIKNKKGALELSVNTIIIIVIGVTLLVLGLQFVRGIITKGIDISDKAFEDANRQLSALGDNINEFVTIAPELVRIKAGDTSGFVVFIKNIEENTYSNVVANIKTSDEALKKKVKCKFSDGTTTKNIRSPLGPGVEERLKVRVETRKSSIGSSGCEFSLSGGGIEQSTFPIRRDIDIEVK